MITKWHKARDNPDQLELDRRRFSLFLVLGRNVWTGPTLAVNQNVHLRANAKKNGKKHEETGVLSGTIA